METYAERCAGIDIGKADVKVCLRVPGHGRALTGSRSARSGRPRTRCSSCGSGSSMSFVPPPPIRRLRDLTRYRASLIHDRTRHVQRLHNVLEDAGIKLSLVASDIMGVSGRAMIAALIRGERDPLALADLAVGKLRPKTAALVEALTGRFEDHHAMLCQMMLDQIDHLSENIDRLSVRIDAQLEPYRRQQERLVTIPGVGKRAAEVIIAETGGDMRRFPTPGHLSSWAGLCPGNNESAGRHLSGRTRNGNAWLCGMLGDCASSASRSKNTYLAERYRRLQRRRGRKRATVALSRTILESAWWVMSHDVDYQDLGPEHFLTRAPDPGRRAQRLLLELRVLGYDIRLPDPPGDQPNR